MTHPLQDLVAGAAISDQQLRVLLFIAPELNGREFREVKQDYVAKRLGLQQPRVSAALQALVGANYLVAGPRSGSANTYRLNLTHDVIRRLYAEALGTT